MVILVQFNYILGYFNNDLSHFSATMLQRVSREHTWCLYTARQRQSQLSSARYLHILIIYTCRLHQVGNTSLN